MKYLLFTTKPEGNPEISKRNFVSPTQCEGGYFIDIQFKQICIDFGWTEYSEVGAITVIEKELITIDKITALKVL